MANRKTKPADLDALFKLLEAAKGENRSFREYARAAGVQHSIFNRIKRKEFVPGLLTLQKLTSEEAAPQNGVTLSKLWQAAGAPEIVNLTYGYDGEKYHVNWGWGGYYDGYYALDALGKNDWKFQYNHSMLYHLYPGNLKQRIIGLFGSNYEERLLPVRQEAERVCINGYIVKAEYAKKTRGEQYFFVNKRFIKHAYLHHAIENAFMEMVPKDSFPGYFLNIEVDPSDIDINIHPTKTEVNFLDVKLVYAILHAAVRKAIGQHNLSPMIDFNESAELNNDFGAAMGMPSPLAIPNVPIDPNFNPFSKESTPRESRWEGSYQSHRNAPSDDWRLLYGERTDLPNERIETSEDAKPNNQYLQVNQSYIVTAVKSGLLLIDQHLAHSRVLFEKYLKELENHCGSSQQELFPQALSLNLNDASLLKEMSPELGNLGFVLEQVNPSTFMINGTPADAAGCDTVALLEKILDNFKLNRTDLQLDRKLNLAKTMAMQLSIKPQTKLSEVEMQNIVDQLFACNVAEVDPNGKKIYVLLSMEDLFK